MRRIALGLLLAFGISSGASAQESLSQWVQMAPGGGQEARVIRLGKIDGGR